MNNKINLAKILFVILLGDFTNTFPQYEIIDVALPECYTFFYNVHDLTLPNEKYWDKASSDNVYGNGTYHGGHNQQWIVMPTYPGSFETMFINRQEGKILDRSSSQNNLYCYTGKHHGGANQLFKLDERSAGQYAIECKDIFKIIDRSTSNNNLYCNTPHYGDNQRFHFTTASQIPNSANLNVFCREQNIDIPPQPVSLDDPGTSSYVKHNYTFVGETIIPFAYVEENSRDWSWQALNSPYYRLKRYQYYILVEAKTVGYGLGEIVKNTYTVGCTQNENTSIKLSLGIEMTYSNGVTIGDPKDAQANIGYNLGNNWNVEFTTAYSTELVTQKTDETTFIKNTNDALRIFIYRLVTEYKLYRIYGDTEVLQWDLTADNNHCWMSFPYTDIEFESQFKSGNTIYSNFRQSAPNNRIPRMYSNTTPSGMASASSSLSSTYYPWKAFDGENESSSGSRWISSPAGTYTTQWIKYEFDEPVTLMAYSILPETGGCIDRSPNIWSIQGSDNGTMWQTIDSRSGYSISDWQSESNRQFSVQYPKKFQKYRLVIYNVNGSNVVSIQKFKIFGKVDAGSLKSVNVTEPDVNYQMNESVAQLEIYPNPNKGIFTLELNNLESIEEHNFVDSLKYINYLKSGIRFEEYLLQDKLIEIYDLRGQLIHSVRTDKNILELSLDGVSKGVYIIKVNFNQTVLTKRFIIE